MNNFEINQHLKAGDTKTPGVVPHIEELPSLPFIFEQDFGLDALPEEPGILVIRGPRQYGKSTWLEQQIISTIEKFGPGSAFYLNCDEIIDKQDLITNIRQLLPMFSNTATIKRIFIDEISAIDNWQQALKRLADAGEIREILLVTTGSKATDLRRGTERLPGRKGKLNRSSYIFTPISYKEFFNKCANTFGDDTLYAYILSGGTAIGANSLARHGVITENIVEIIIDWIFGEFASTGRSRSQIMSLMSVLFKFAGTPVGQSKLARESGLSNNTVAKEYIEILSDLMTVFPSYKYDLQHNVPIFRKECKYHFSNMLVAMCIHPKRPRSITELKSFSTTEFAGILEWQVAQELFRRNCIKSAHFDHFLFWSNADHEIDFVEPSEDLWIEVKSGSFEANNFAWFLKSLPQDKSLHVINKDVFTSQRIHGISISDFLLD